MNLNSDAIEQDYQRWVNNPGPPPGTDFKTWGAIKALGKSPIAGALDYAALGADMLFSTGGSDTMRPPPTQGGFDVWSNPVIGALGAGADIISGQRKTDPTIGNAIRRKADEFAPDPITTSHAEQVIGDLGRGVSKAVGAMVIGGPVGGPALFGLEEANNTYQRLLTQGVDEATARKVAGVTGVTSAVSVAVPAGGSTWARTAAIAAVGGPASFVAQEGLSRDILKRAGYTAMADQHDPTDPLGLILSIGIPGAVGALHMRGVNRSLAEVVKHIESGGQRFDKAGNLLTSPKGAQGEMQVMPGTATDPGFGVAPAKDNSPDELARVGRDYLGAMTERYGDTEKALAAYNAGPGAVDAAVKKHGADWLAHMPDETKAYVGKARRLMRDSTIEQAARDPVVSDAARVQVLDDVVARSLPDRPSAYGEVMRASDEVAAGNVREDLAPPAAYPETQPIIEATRPVSFDEATALVAGRTEKPGGVDPRRVLEAGSGNGAQYRLGNVPLELFVKNEDGARYDGTVDLARAQDYAARPAEGAPPIIASQGRRDGMLRVHDGGHRISAARLRGDATIPALVSVRDPAAPLRQPGAPLAQRLAQREPSSVLPPARDVELEQPAAAASTAAAPTSLDTQALDRLMLENPGLLVKLPGSDKTLRLETALERIKEQQIEDAEPAKWVQVALDCALSGRAPMPKGPA